MSEFKWTNVYEKSNEYAKGRCNEEIGNKFIPETDLSVYDACELDFRNGYNQALEDTRAPEILEMLKDSVEVIKWYMENSTTELHEPFFNIGENQIKRTEQLIKQATEL